MKKILIAAIAGLFTFNTLHAQEIPERKHDGVKQRMHSKKPGGKEMAGLDLTADQKEKMKSLNSDYRKQMEDLKSQDGLTVKESREKMETLRKEHQSKTQALLTAEQKIQLEKNKAGFKDGGKKARKMKQELNLTDEQSAKLDAGRKESMQKMKAIREDKSLTEEQKKEQTRAVMKQQKENMKSVLSKEQLQQMQDSRKKKDKKTKE